MSTNSREVRDLLECLSNLVRATVRTVCNEHGLRPVQLEALRFLTRCYRSSDTTQAVTEFLGLTEGTVSKILRDLERKGLLRKRRDAKDKSVIHLNPTAKGRRLVERAVPAASVALGIGKLSISDSQVTADSLRALLRSVQIANDLKTFSPCHVCRFNQKREGGYLCGLTHEPLTEQDAALLSHE